jgi:threonine/homoserine/homoserine lactone efflux protein
MLLLFGRFKEPARAVLGIGLVVIGIVLHQLIATVAGALLLVWGGVNVLRGWRRGRVRRDRARERDQDGPAQ